MALTPEADIQDAIVLVLGTLGGSGPRGEVLAGIEAHLAGVLTAEDQDSVTSRPWDKKWKNNASFARDHMKHSLLTGRADGVWELSASGWDRYRSLRSGAVGLDGGASDPFALFKPSSTVIVHYGSHHTLPWRNQVLGAPAIVSGFFIAGGLIANSFGQHVERWWRRPDQFRDGAADHGHRQFRSFFPRR